MSKDNSLAHTKWECKYHIVFAPKYRRQVIYKAIKTYIQKQLQEDLEYDQMSLVEYMDPFTGEPVARIAAIFKNRLTAQRQKLHDGREKFTFLPIQAGKLSLLYSLFLS